MTEKFDKSGWWEYSSPWFVRAQRRWTEGAHVFLEGRRFFGPHAAERAERWVLDERPA